MIDMTLERLKPEDEKRAAEFAGLRERIILARDAELEAQRQKASQTFYHFGKLPLEVAHFMFSMILDEDPAFVVVLAGVCRSWRDLVVATPAFWRSLVLSKKEPSRKAKLWKTRSEGKLERLDIRHGDDMKIMWAVHELEHISLQSLRALALQGVRLDHFFKMLPNCTPDVISNLETLRLDSLPMQNEVWDLTKLPFTRLQRFHCQKTDVHWPKFADHCSTLREFSYQGTLSIFWIPDALWLICNNRELETLEFEFTPNEPPWAMNGRVRTTPLSDVVLPQLTTLKLRAGPPGLVTKLTGSASLPSLRTLHISSMPSSCDAILQNCVDRGWLSRLTELKLESLAFDDLTIMFRIMQAADDLQTLSLSKMATANQFLELLASTHTSAPGQPARVLCPKLTTLTVNYCPDVKTGPVLRLIKLRNDTAGEATDTVDLGLSRINKLSLDGCEIEAEHLPWFRRMVPVFSCVYQTRKEAKVSRR